MILTDDLGWNSVYHNPRTITPFIDSLAAAEGLKLTSHYTYKFCAPSRASFLTGRLPYHLASTRSNFIPSSIPEGTHLGYKMLPEHLAKAGYHSVHIGKWHQGFVTEEYTPVGRGFHYSFGFLEGGEDHFTSASFNSARCEDRGVDLSYGWDNGTRVRAAWGRNGTYTGYQFSEEAVAVIKDHSSSRARPLFLYLALQNTHAPTQAPESFVSMYDHTPVAKDPREKRFNAQVSFVDEVVRNITSALKATGMWDNSFVVWTTDNGAPVQVAGSNHPLRGGKGYDWEGGTRVPTFVTGGRLPERMRGRSLDGLAHICDWYATFSSLAGLGGEADPSGPADPESLDLSGWLFGSSLDSPREGIVYDHRMYSDEERANPTGAIRVGDLKLVVGPAGGVGFASWYGLFSPNSSGVKPDLAARACPFSRPCLFNVSTGADVGEHHDLAAERPGDVARLLGIFGSLEHAYHPPSRNPPLDSAAFCRAAAANGGFLTPWWRPPGSEELVV